MTFNGQGEVLETIDEITFVVSGLDRDLTDKKGISDVMLALEKILPPIEGNFPEPVAALCAALALLYEKFLMETVDQGAKGIALSSKGLAVLKAVAAGGSDEAAAEAVPILQEMKDTFNVAAPGYNIPAEPAAAPAPSEPEDEEAEDDNFFAAAAETVPEQAAEEGGGEEEMPDPLAEKVSQIANDVTMLDADMSDKKLVSGIMLGFENLLPEMEKRESEASLVAVARTLAALFEKSLMEGLSQGQKAIGLTVEGIMILESYFEKVYPENLPEQAMAVVQRIGADFGLAPPVMAKHEAAPAAAAEPGPAGFEIVTVASGEEMIIYTEFVAEVHDAVAGVESDLLALEEDPADEELINNIFRAFHSMKGAAGFLGVNTATVLCHEAESLLDKFRKKVLVCNQEMIDALLKTLDVIKLVNEGLNDNCQSAKERMPNAELSIPRYAIDRLVNRLAELSERKPVAPAPVAGNEEEVAPLGEMLIQEHKISEEQLDAALRAQERRPIGEILVDMGAVDKKTVDEALKAQSERKKRTQAASLKIDTEKLDSLLELVGELVISQSQVSQDETLLDERNRTLLKNLMNLGKITKRIQDQVMTLRMVPLKQTFQKMSRLVRDLSKKMKKPVTFKVSGEETEIDKTLIEELNDPLVHLLRNAMDHGLEPADDRVATGKSPMGNVWLSASHRGGNVHIEIVDDGKGMDQEKIRKKGIEKGLIAPDAAITSQEVYDLILLPGFSTHEVATDISGRGVGMDVVKSNIDKLGGRLEIASKPGQGSTFTVKLPLTMAIVDGMIVQIGGDRFVIPTTSIRESIRPRPEEISTFQKDGEMIDVRGRLLPLVRLHKFLDITNAVFLNPWEGLVIVVESDDREYGFMVDDLLGQQQVVIKSLDRRFKGLPGISGGTILGDGHVGLILDVSGVIEAH